MTDLTPSPTISDISDRIFQHSGGYGLISQLMRIRMIYDNVTILVISFLWRSVAVWEGWKLVQVNDQRVEFIPFRCIWDVDIMVSVFLESFPSISNLIVPQWESSSN